MAGVPWPSLSTMLLARESARTIGCRAACGVRECPRGRRPVVAVAARGAASDAADGLNVSVSCRVPDVSCGGLRGSAATTFGFSGTAVRRRAGTAVKRSCMLAGGLEVQLRVHASQRSPGCASTAWRIAAPSAHALVGCPGRPATDTEVGDSMAVVEGGGLVMASSMIRKPLPGIQSVLVSPGGGEEEGSIILGGRESSVCVPEYALGALRYVCVVRREGARETLRSMPCCRRSRIP